MLTGELGPRRRGLGPRRESKAQASRQSEGTRERKTGGSHPATVRTAQRPHQEAEGTRRTRSSAVHARLRGRRCTEHWRLLARTPAAREERGRREGDQSAPGQAET